MEFRLSLTLLGGFFAVPNAVADQHMKLCSENQLKTLLLMLRFPEQPATQQWIAKELKISPADALDHLQYWCEQGLVCCGEEPAAPAAGAPVSAPVHSAAPVPTTSHTAPTGQKVTTNARPRLTAADINRMAQTDSNIPLLLQETQLLLGRELTPSQTGVLMELYSEYNLSPQFIFTLINYCVSIDKGNMNYIGSVAAGWLEQGITTVEQAEQEIERLRRARSREGQVQTAFGITGRSLTTSQKAHIGRWFEEYGMDLEMIRLAYDQTVDNIGKLSFPYLDKVLLNWHQQGLKTPAEAAAANQNRKNAKTEEKPSYDMNVLNRFFELGNIK